MQQITTSQPIQVADIIYVVAPDETITVTSGKEVTVLGFQFIDNSSGYDTLQSPILINEGAINVISTAKDGFCTGIGEQDGGTDSALIWNKAGATITVSAPNFEADDNIAFGIYAGQGSARPSSTTVRSPWCPRTILRWVSRASKASIPFTNNGLLQVTGISGAAVSLLTISQGDGGGGFGE